MALRQPDKIKSNNPAEYGIVDAAEVAGHKSVQTLSDLYALSDAILSPSKTNANDDAIGQEWYVVGENCRYRLKNWANRNNKNGWLRILYGAGKEYPMGGIVMSDDCRALGSGSFATGCSTIAYNDFTFCSGWSEDKGNVDDFNGVPFDVATAQDMIIEHLFKAPYSGAIGEGSCSIGISSASFNSDSVAFGRYDVTVGGSIAGGYCSCAIGNSSISLGYRAFAYGEQSLYLGSSCDSYYYKREMDVELRNVDEFSVNNHDDHRLYVDILCEEQIEVRNGQVVVLAQKHRIAFGKIEYHEEIQGGLRLILYEQEGSSPGFTPSFTDGQAKIKILRNVSSGNHSVCIGSNCIAYNDNEVAIGSGNMSNSDTAFSLGMGSEPTSSYEEVIRKNGVEMMTNGDFYFMGIGGYDGTNPDTSQSVQQVIANLTERLAALEGGTPTPPPTPTPPVPQDGILGGGGANDTEFTRIAGGGGADESYYNV